MDSICSFRCRAEEVNSITNGFDKPITYFKFSGLDLLKKHDDGLDEDASDSSYSSYCNDSLQLSGVPKTPMGQRAARRSSIDGTTSNQSILAMNKMQRSASLSEMISWLSTGDEECEDDLDVESSICLTRQTRISIKSLDVHTQSSQSFSSDILASQALAGGAGRAA